MASGVKPSTILIVDDTPANIGPLAESLEDRGFRVVVAQGGCEALDRAELVRPDLILLDVMMPEVDGFETCRRLKMRETLREIPVIFMTALDEVADRLAGFGAGGVDYVTKPLQIDEVLARADTHVALRAAQQRLTAARDELEERVEQRTMALKESESRIRRLVESNILGISFWSLDGSISAANDEFLRIIGYTRADLDGGAIRWNAMTPPEWRAADERANEELQRSGTCAPYEKEYVRKDGTRAPVLVGGALFEGSREQGVAFILDLCQRKRDEARIHYMAHHDALTGLPNRALLDDRLEQAIAQARRAGNVLAALLIDLDGFKDVNDSLGHHIGDLILCEAARRLQLCVREGDTVSRQGGDEFVVALTNLEDGSGAAVVAAKVVEAFQRPFVVDALNVRLTASVGISLYPADGDNAAALLRSADAAMYSAKAVGRDNFQYFAEGLNAASRQRLEIASALHGAVERQELELHFQPQVDLATGEVDAAEALLRWWRDADLVSCGEFIGIAEETGLIVSIGEWVLREACRQLKRWHSLGHTQLHIAVNVSPRQLRQPAFDQVVRRALGEAALDPGALELEITESMLMQQTPEILAMLSRLVALGVRLSIDDFGIGYSNLGYLRRFPVHSLKIDRSFVEDVVSDANNRAIVLAIIAMAKSLGMKVVAEGVETREQADFLRAQGCDAVQGFFYAKPVSASRFTERMLAPAAANLTPQ